MSMTTQLYKRTSTFSGHANTQTGLEATVAARVASSRVDDAVLTTLADVRRVFRQTATKELLHAHTASEMPTFAKQKS